MGITIEEAIHHLSTYSSTMGSGQTTQAQHEESKRVAISTMRKYQQIIDAMLMNDMVENIYFAIEEILKDDLEQDERFGK